MTVVMVASAHKREPRARQRRGHWAQDTERCVPSSEHEARPARDRGLLRYVHALRPRAARDSLAAPTRRVQRAACSAREAAPTGRDRLTVHGAGA